MPKLTLENENDRPHPVANEFDLLSYETVNEDIIDEFQEKLKVNFMGEQNVHANSQNATNILQ